MPWCKGCQSHHVAPMLWRYAGVKAGARLDSERRYVLGTPGRTPAAAEAVRHLQKPNRALLATDDALRRRMFRPVASPGAVLTDGRLVGLWRVKAKGRKAEITVERLGRVARAGLEHEAQRVAELRGSSEAILVLD